MEKILDAEIPYQEYHIIPLPNPDGYVHTWNKDRFWYKNRQVVEPKAKCVGLDMNRSVSSLPLNHPLPLLTSTHRNWGYKWKPHARDQDPGFSLLGHRRPVDPCSHWYPGSRPFEAPETNNIANYVATLPDARGFLDLRSYGQISGFPSFSRLPFSLSPTLRLSLPAIVPC